MSVCKFFFFFLVELLLSIIKVIDWPNWILKGKEKEGTEKKINRKFLKNQGKIGAIYILKKKIISNRAK